MPIKRDPEKERLSKQGFGKSGRVFYFGSEETLAKKDDDWHIFRFLDWERQDGLVAQCCLSGQRGWHHIGHYDMGLSSLGSRFFQNK